MDALVKAAGLALHNSISSADQQIVTHDSSTSQADPPLAELNAVLVISA
jgi:hypothetical protein